MASSAPTSIQSVSASFPFDTDLIDLTLTTLCDIHSLQSFVLSSKFVYNVFSARRDSILGAVVANHLGPAAPPAVRLLKVMTNVNAFWHGWIAPFPTTKLPREEDFQTHDPRVTITMREAHLLATNHDVIREIESLYSWRKKDPRSSSSRLTPQESERFQAALYRVWFVCALYGRSAPANRVGKSKSRRLPEIRRDLGRAQAKFLQAFSPVQLAPLLETWEFLIELAAWAVRAEFFAKTNYRSLEAYLIWSGPKMTLQAFQGKLTGIDIDRKVVPALSASYEHFCVVFNALRLPEKPATGILLSRDECFLGRLKCQRCTRTHPGDLWSESNWSYLRGRIPPSRFFLRLELPWWNSYTSAERLENICRNVPYSQLVEQIFTLRSEAYQSWEPGHWLCTTCLQTFLHDNIETLCRTREYSEQADP